MEAAVQADRLVPGHRARRGPSHRKREALRREAPAPEPTKQGKRLWPAGNLCDAFSLFLLFGTTDSLSPIERRDKKFAAQSWGWIIRRLSPADPPRQSQRKYAPDQNSKRSTPDRIRAGRVLLGTPKLLLICWPAALNVAPLLTPVNSGWLKTLYPSKRTTNARRSLPTGKRLAILASKLVHAGPRRIFTPALPMVPTAGSPNAAMLNSTGRPVTLCWGGAACASPITLMRAPRLELPVMLRVGDVPKLGVKGAPDCVWTIPASTQ